MDPRRLARKAVLGLERPVHGGLGWKYEGIEDFSSNLNPYGPPEEMSGFISEAASKLAHYPDDSSEEFRSAICEHHDVDMANVIAGAGSAELIRLFPETFLEAGDMVLMPRPTFSEYAFGCRLQGATVVEMPLEEENDLRLDIGKVIENIGGCKAVYLCNPNNPTGNIVPRKEVLELVRECERASVLMFLDETLLELVKGSKDISCVKEVDSFSNLFVIRSLTKCFAMPGMRIGYGVGGRDIVKLMSSARLSWNLGKIEQHVGARLLRDCQGHVAKAADMMASEGTRMSREIARTGVVEARVPDSFFFFSRCNGMKGSDVQGEMLERKVLVRDCASFGAPFDSYVRFAVKTPERNDMLISAFRSLAEARGRD
ncbi:MAG: histidinol-phosphate aminotransferase family protein [Euryarchaeota archaeon]|nr:histidinol-phosphate aminotransferase family protein [Euryarchaeota archaeon]